MSAGAVREHERPSRRQDDFTSTRHVYEPHRVGLPPMRSYLRELWRRRQFALEMSRTTLRAQHFKSVLGQFWLVLNPLLLTLVYFLLVDILRSGNRGPEFFAHLMAGLFAFHFYAMAVNQGARSVVGGGRLILNTAFPRTLLPISSVMTAFMRFLPTIVVYAVMHAIAGLPVGPETLYVIPIIATIAIFATGMAMLASAAQVYFRDIKNFLPYLMRIWMYGSPVLYYYDEVPEHLRWIIDLNPLTPMLASLSRVLNFGLAPRPGMMLWGAAWAVGMLVFGSLLFISREREFAVRL
jgi:ABC-type polysaccharide/polyol phosphate export permease